MVHRFASVLLPLIALCAPASSQSSCLFADLVPGPGGSEPRDLCFVKEQDRLIFSATHPSLGRELWVSDGTTAGTRVLDLGPGAADPQKLRVVGAGRPALWGSAVAFTARCGSSRALWMSDGTLAGTRRIPLPGATCHDVFDWVDGGTPGVPWLRRLFVLAGPASARTLWQFEHDRRTRRDRVTKLATGAIDRVLSVAGVPYFVKRSATSPAELWRLLGTAPAKVADYLQFGANFVVGPRLFFEANAAGLGSQLWTTDITTARARRLDAGTGSRSEGVSNFVQLGSYVYFALRNDAHGNEVFRTTWTKNGPVELVVDLVPGPAGSAPSELRATASRVCFVATTPKHGEEVWTTGGSASTTRLVADLEAGPAGSAPWSLAQFGNGDDIVFHASTRSGGAALYASDGTPANTRVLCRARPSFASRRNAAFMQVGCDVFFPASEASRGSELYRIESAALGIHVPIMTKVGRGGLGTAGRRAEISGTHVPRLRQTLGVLLHKARPAAPAVLLVSLGCRPSSVPLAPSCNALIGPGLFPFGNLVTDTQGFGAIYLNAWSLGLPIGTRFTAQFVIFDPEGCFGSALTVSDGLRVGIGR